MSSTNIMLGLAIIAIGIYAIVFNKYPGKEMSYENAIKRCNTANERKVTLFDGIFCIIYGVAYITLGMIVLAILLLAYYPVRILFLKLKLI
ncbi:hypothetical protein KTC96_14880 [Clostridium estertheticum]|uniref:hypothetical protein n=1 Tax=Clostridium estertheticum TaxID=238834 RepID=UPI001C7CC1BF|nr:hypothetical protein [Clostridium estertheticum]MBX4258720.1 hypothetical protein [Clostridium estertheticum]WLC69264.1 hypothetical protein KTC96_14880 [Clostridium estertheticum]